MNLKGFAENLGLEEEEFLKLVELYIETSASDLNKLKSAIDEENMQKVAEAAISIKDASRDLGFVEARKAAKEIEWKAAHNHLEGIYESAQVLKKELDIIAELTRG